VVGEFTRVVGGDKWKVAINVAVKLDGEWWLKSIVHLWKIVRKVI
jgi:hypothetical protein